MVNSRYKFTICFSFLLLASIIQGCATVPNSYDNTIGTLRILGSGNVEVDGSKASDGQLIKSGNSIKVGANSSAYLYFLDDGFIHFDENTDPVFELIWQQASCFIKVVKFGFGQVFEDAKSKCKTIYQLSRGTVTHPHTQFNLKVEAQQFVLTVLEDEMALSKPNSQIIKVGQQITVSKRGTNLTNLTTEQLQEVTQWREKYPEPGRNSDSTLDGYNDVLIPGIRDVESNPCPAWVTSGC